MPDQAGARRRPGMRAAAFCAVTALSGLALAGCGSHKAPPPLKVKGTTLPSHAGRVRLTQPAYRGPALALYRSAARYFRWPLLVPQTPPDAARPAGATVSRFFAGSFTIDLRGRASQVPGSYVPGNPVAPAAYQLRLTYLGRRGLVTLFEAVSAYVPPKGARSVALPGGLTHGLTWQSRPAPGTAPLRYLEGRVDGLYLMVYAVAREASEAALSSYLANLRSVAVPPGKAPAAAAAPSTPASRGHGQAKKMKKKKAGQRSSATAAGDRRAPR